MKTLIKHAFVVSVDPSIGDIDGGDILIENGVISAVGISIEAEGAEPIDATGCIAIPGFVDTHRHFWEGALRSSTADWALLDFAGNMLVLASTCLRPQDMYATSLQGGLEALNAGVTTVADYCHNVISPEHAEQAVQGLRDSGVRAIWCYSFNQTLPARSGFADMQSRLAFLEDFGTRQFSAPGELVTLGVCPEEMAYWPTSRDSVVKSFELARHFGAPIFVHANGYTVGDGEYPGEVELIDGFGLLGPDLTLVHMGYTKESEWQRLGEAGVNVSFTPETELQMGMNMPPITAAKATGVNISIGVDITANNSGDLFTQMRMALQIERAKLAAPHAGALYSRTGIDCAEALYWGTMGGARAVGLQDRIGSLTPGKDADVVLLRADGIAMVGWDRGNPSATVVQQAGTHVVDTVLVRGRVVKRDGRLLADERRACALLEQTSRHVRTEAAKQGGFDLSTEELYGRLSSRMAAADGQAA
ncbi:amidohydrolase family protein [Rhizorhabdus dicambivorans]|uniref:amidohydrolase family protein n=1 Tax=Rhizorhabdus dicambivorans TaxID=1850238 RepID=UPI00082C640F|nr:amidohydrolase family protein [Rhizorhabdus dicambivorans]